MSNVCCIKYFSCSTHTQSLAFNYIEPEGCVLDKPPIIFLHGITASKEYWFDIPHVIADATKRKVYVLDSMHHGDSPWTDTFSFDGNANDLHHFLDTHHLPQATLVGHSMGGITAIQTALRWPDRVESVIVEDMGVHGSNSDVLHLVRLNISLALQGIQQIPSGADERKAKRVIYHYVYDHLPPEVQKFANRDNEALYYMQLRRSPDGKYTFKANMEHLQKSLMLPSVLPSKIKSVFEGPAYFIYGTLSPVKVNSQVKEIKEIFPKAELIPIVNGRHSLHVEFPKEFTSILLDIFSKNL